MLEGTLGLQTRAANCDSLYRHIMARISSAAPLFGAALAAALMVAGTAAFQAGAGAASSQAAEPEAAPPPLAVSSVASVAPPPALASGAGVVELENLDPTPAAAAQPPARARLAVIIDDVADLEIAQRLWSLNGPITLAVLPYADAAPQIARRADGREIFVHLPMEPVGLEDPGPNALTKSLGARDFQARLSWAFLRVPGAAGFNNHMGSRLTADRDAMTQLFASLQGRSSELVFLDSLTHPRSVAGAVAEEAGFKVLRRTVFLDHQRDPASINAQIETALEMALLRGQAIAIGHPYPETLQALSRLKARAEAAGVELTTVSALAAD